MNTTDNLATLKVAAAAGETIQAYTTWADDGQLPIDHEAVNGYGIWRDLEGPVQWSFHPSRYRVKVEDTA